MPKVSAPGSVFLFGEHAVVYGYPAVVASINRGITVRAETNQRKVLQINSDLGTLRADVQHLPKGGRLSYVVEAVKQVFEHLGERRGVNLEITSQLPPASGLGTSSAVCAATVGAVAEAMEKRLTEEEVVELAFRSELAVQKLASRAGVSAAVLGGFLLLEGKKRRRMKSGQLPAVVGWSGLPSATARMVQLVRKEKEKRPQLFDTLFRFMGEVTTQGARCLERGELERVGILMDLNHSLLSALHIVPPRIEKMVRVAREAGALGAKMTGAGGGGCMLALVRERERVVRALQKAGAQAFPVRLGGEGLRFS
ncbi:MAG: mevalonate kinase [Candidatus Hadarchaeales archaeon]